MIILERFAYTPVGTFGKLFVDELDFFCYTVERPWVNNEKMKSCIPEGSYTAKWHNSPKFGKVMALEGPTVSIAPSVNKKRSAILIHPANTMDDLLGCIGLGDSLGFYKDKWAVLGSRQTVDSFFSKMAPFDNVAFIIKQIEGAITNAR